MEGRAAYLMTVPGAFMAAGWPRLYISSESDGISEFTDAIFWEKCY